MWASPSVRPPAPSLSVSLKITVHLYQPTISRRSSPCLWKMIRHMGPKGRTSENISKDRQVVAICQSSRVKNNQEKKNIQEANLQAAPYLVDKLAKSPPSNSLILQNRTPFTKGTAVSSSRVKLV